VCVLYTNTTLASKPLQVIRVLPKSISNRPTYTYIPSILFLQVYTNTTLASKPLQVIRVLTVLYSLPSILLLFLQV